MTFRTWWCAAAMLAVGCLEAAPEGHGDAGVTPVDGGGGGGSGFDAGGAGGGAGGGGGGGGGSAPSDGGVPPVDAGQAPRDAGAAGRVYSTNRAEFFGAPRCGDLGLLFCDDFESETAGAEPDPASWKPEYWGHPAGTSVAIDGALAARGTKSARFTIGAGADKAMMTLRKPFPVAGNAFWVRLFLYANKVPLPFKWDDTAHYPLTHWTFAYASGPHVFGTQTLHPELRAGGLINQVPLMNEDGMDRAEVGIDDSNPPQGQTAFPEKQWVCFEMYWSGPDQEMRLFWDGVEHPGLHLTKTHSGGTNDSNPPWPMGDPFDALTLGLVMYQAYDKIGPSISVNIDEVALDAQRIGCGN